MPIKKRLNLLNLFNAKYIVSAQELNLEGLKLVRLEPGGLVENISSESLTDLKEKGTIKIYQNEKVLPRAFLAENCQVISNESDYPATFSRDDFNPVKKVLLDKSPEGLTCSNEVRSLDSTEVVKILDLKSKKEGQLPTHTLRYWEKEFKQIKPKILAGNRRYYDVKTIEIIKNIKFLLKDKGMTIEGVKKQLDNDETDLDETVNISINTKNILKTKLNKISKLIKDIKK